jgi:predicted nucleic acid-binding protein
VKFWDSSALVPLILREATSDRAQAALAADTALAVWWGSPVECLAAVARAERDQRLDAAAMSDAAAALRLLRSGWSEIDATTRLREIAERLVRTHPLRAADAFQLAAATVAAEGETRLLPFVTLDERLAVAADREGFPVVRFDRPSP